MEKHKRSNSANVYQFRALIFSLALGTGGGDGNSAIIGDASEARAVDESWYRY